MNILFMIRSLEAGGAERQMLTLANRLASQGNKVAIAVYYSGGSLEPLLENVMLIDLEKKGRWHLAGFFFHLLRKATRFKPALVNSYMPETNLVSIFLKPFLGCPVVWGIRASNMISGKYGLVSKTALYAEALLSRFADHIIVNSHAGYHVCIKRGFPESKMSVIHNGINTSVYSPTEGDTDNRFRETFTIGPDDILVGMVARLDPMKDHLNFFKAIKKVQNYCSGVFFICVGSGTNPYRSFLEEQIQALGIEDSVVLAGHISDMSTVYNALDILCSSSRYGEGFSNAIGEAMACGIPCVATNVGDAGEVIGSTGIIVSPGNADELAQGLMDMISLYRKGKIDHNKIRKRVVETFSVDTLTEETTRIYKSLI